MCPGDDLESQAAEGQLEAPHRFLGSALVSCTFPCSGPTEVLLECTKEHSPYTVMYQHWQRDNVRGHCCSIIRWFR